MKNNFYKKQSPETIHGTNKHAPLNPDNVVDIVNIPIENQLTSLTGIVSTNTLLDSNHSSVKEWFINNWKLTGDFNFEKYANKIVIVNGSSAKPLNMEGINSFNVDDISIIEVENPTTTEETTIEEVVEEKAPAFSTSKRNRNLAVAITCVVIIIALIFIFKK